MAKNCTQSNTAAPRRVCHRHPFVQVLQCACRTLVFTCCRQRGSWDHHLQRHMQHMHREGYSHYWHSLFLQERRNIYQWDVACTYFSASPVCHRYGVHKDTRFRQVLLAVSCSAPSSFAQLEVHYVALVLSHTLGAERIQRQPRKQPRQRPWP